MRLFNEETEQSVIALGTLTVTSGRSRQHGKTEKDLVQRRVADMIMDAKRALPFQAFYYS